MKDLYCLSGGQGFENIAAEETASPEQQGWADPLSTLFRVGTDGKPEFLRIDRFGEGILPDRIIEHTGNILQFVFYIRKHNFTTIFLDSGIRYNKKKYFSSDFLLESVNLRAIF